MEQNHLYEVKMSDEIYNPSKKQFAKLYWGAFLMGSIAGTGLTTSLFCKYIQNSQDAVKMEKHVDNKSLKSKTNQTTAISPF